jgi:Flp pilus assembly protein TadD
VRVRAWLSLALAAAGCATTPLDKQEWLAVRTAHYEIWSSIGADATARLAVEIERFRGAAEYVWGSALPNEPVRTRVYAFDDRGPPRLFAYLHQRSYVLPTRRGDLIVLRTGGGWEGDAWTELKLAYARRLMWNASPQVLPPWLEEGLPEVASTLEVTGAQAIVGMLRDDHVHTLREEKWIPFDRLLAASNLDGWTKHDREILEAESWALCHYLLLGADRRGSAREELARFRARLRSGASPGDAARSSLGAPEQNAVYRYVTRNEFDTAKVNLPLRRAGAPELRAVPQPEAVTRLGELALAIGDSALARDYLERAVKSEADSARASTALGDALVAQRDFAGAELSHAAALAAAPEDPIVHLGQANYLLARARESDDGLQRADHVREAREHYQRARELAGVLPEADEGLAETYLLPGEDPALGRAPLRAARAALPGDAELMRLDARLSIAQGDAEAARRTASVLLARARTASEIEAARSLLDQIDVRAAIR